LYGGAVPMQSQETICGGRYLSCDDTMRVFAAGTTTNQMRIEVRWRSGKRSVVDGVKSNRIYEIHETAAEASSKPKAECSKEAPDSKHRTPEISTTPVAIPLGAGEIEIGLSSDFSVVH